jgi:hypothetical protein
MEREAHDWFGHSVTGPGLNSKARKFVHELHEKFTSSSEAGSDLFSKFVKENEERFLLHCSARAPVGGIEQGGRDFIRSFSAGSGWTMPPLRTEEDIQSPFSQTSPPTRLPNMDKTFFGSGFPMFLVSNRQMWAESRSEKFSMSRSSVAYHTNMCR